MFYAYHNLKVQGKEGKKYVAHKKYHLRDNQKLLKYYALKMGYGHFRSEADIQTLNIFADKTNPSIYPSTTVQLDTRNVPVCEPSAPESPI